MSEVIKQRLKLYAKAYKCEKTADVVLNDERFWLWTGSSEPNKHHYGDGGLAQHTWEVVKLCLSNSQTFGLDKKSQKELYLSALFHDIGKTHDYKKVEGRWIKNDHCRRVGHISRSCIIFNSASDNNECGDVAMGVTHNILSHHGCREWGSPVSSATKEAWILHTCDMMSARVDDCEKFDRF